MFVKDSSGLVINKDDTYYKSILSKRQQKKKICDLENQLYELNSELKEIKTMLTALLDGKNYG